MLPFPGCNKLSFLGRLGIEPEDVHDGRGQSKRDWQREARQSGSTLVFGSRCRAGGHRLRTRARYRVECDPKKLAYQQRYRLPAYVDIAGSLAGRVVKIGTAVKHYQRRGQSSTPEIWGSERLGDFIPRAGY